MESEDIAAEKIEEIQGVSPIQCIPIRISKFSTIEATKSIAYNQSQSTSSDSQLIVKQSPTNQLSKSSDKNSNNQIYQCGPIQAETQENRLTTAQIQSTFSSALYDAEEQYLKSYEDTENSVKPKFQPRVEIMSLSAESIIPHYAQLYSLQNDENIINSDRSSIKTFKSDDKYSHISITSSAVIGADNVTGSNHTSSLSTILSERFTMKINSFKFVADLRRYQKPEPVNLVQLLDNNCTQEEKSQQYQQLVQSLAPCHILQDQTHIYYKSDKSEFISPELQPKPLENNQKYQYSCETIKECSESKQLFDEISPQKCTADI